MKANELRIGNYIYQGEKYKESKVTSYELYNFDTKQKGGVVAEYYKEWKPIPLTEEWLVKLGFQHNRAGIFGNNYTLNGVSIQLKVGGVYMFVPHARCEIKYVHQLQNLYFALTGEELLNK